jgi:hypothetical protein
MNSFVTDMFALIQEMALYNTLIKKIAPKRVILALPNIFPHLSSNSSNELWKVLHFWNELDCSMKY